MPTLQQKEAVYKDIMGLFDLVENVVSSMELPAIKNRRAQLALAQPFIQTSTREIEAILNVYLDYVKHGGPPTRNEAKKIEDSMRHIFTELVNVTSRLKELKPEARE